MRAKAARRLLERLVAMLEYRVLDEAVTLRHGEELRPERAEDGVDECVEVSLDFHEGDFKRKRHRTIAPGRRERVAYRVP